MFVFLMKGAICLNYEVNVQKGYKFRIFSRTMEIEDVFMWRDYVLSNAYGIVIIILVINIVYVSFSTIRMILTLKGRRYLAAFVSVFEMMIYIMGLSIVLDNLNGIQNILAYAIGFALGIICGSAIEERLALGYITVNVVSGNPDLPFGEKLRSQGFGVTSWRSSGRDGDRLSMQILAPRKQEPKLYQIVKEIDPSAFLVSYEPKNIQGGFWVKQVRRHPANKDIAVGEVPTDLVADTFTEEEKVDMPSKLVEIEEKKSVNPQNPNIPPKK